MPHIPRIWTVSFRASCNNRLETLKDAFIERGKYSYLYLSDDTVIHTHVFMFIKNVSILETNSVIST